MIKTMRTILLAGLLVVPAVARAAGVPEVTDGNVLAQLSRPPGSFAFEAPGVGPDALLHLDPGVVDDLRRNTLASALNLPWERELLVPVVDRLLQDLIVGSETEDEDAQE